MVKWTSGKSERTLNQNAANGRKEPISTDAARRINGSDLHKVDETNAIRCYTVGDIAKTRSVTKAHNTSSPFTTSGSIARPWQ